jgi:hypothetical protein
MDNTELIPRNKFDYERVEKLKGCFRKDCCSLLNKKGATGFILFAPESASLAAQTCRETNPKPAQDGYPHSPLGNRNFT